MLPLSFGIWLSRNAPRFHPKNLEAFCRRFSSAFASEFVDTHSGDHQINSGECPIQSLRGNGLLEQVTGRADTGQPEVEFNNMLRRLLRDIFMNEIKVKSFSTPWQCYSSTRDVQSCSKSHIATKDGYLPFRRRVSIFPLTKTMTKTMTKKKTKLMTMTKTKAQFLSDSGSPLLSWYSSSKHRHFCQPSSVVFSDLSHLRLFSS